MRSVCSLSRQRRLWSITPSNKVGSCDSWPFLLSLHPGVLKLGWRQPARLLWSNFGTSHFCATLRSFWVLFDHIIKDLCLLHDSFLDLSKVIELWVLFHCISCLAPAVAQPLRPLLLNIKHNHCISFLLHHIPLNCLHISFIWSLVPILFLLDVWLDLRNFLRVLSMVSSATYLWMLLVRVLTLCISWDSITGFLPLWFCIFNLIKVDLGHTLRVWISWYDARDLWLDMFPSFLHSYHVFE